jgi:hypothetical protein
MIAFLAWQNHGFVTQIEGRREEAVHGHGRIIATPATS